MDDFEKELKVGFLDEAAQLLSDAEQCFLNLETASNDPSIIEKLFRLAHNLKGSARAVGFADIAEFTHQLESLLLKIKNKEITIQASTINLLLRCNDHINVMVQGLKANLDARFNSQELLAEIGLHLSGQVPASATPAEAASQEVPVQEAAPAETPPTEPQEEPLAEVAEEDVEEEVTPVTAFPDASDPAFAETAKNAGVDAKALLDDANSVDPGNLDKVVSASFAKPEPAQTAAPAQPGAPSSAAPQQVVDESIRVSLRRLDRLMNNVGELVILQAVLNQQKFQVQSMLVQKTIDQLAKITKDIQDISMSLRMVPLKQTFQKMQRIVRDISKQLNKEVLFEMGGEETELDKTVIEQIGDPLVHLVRNAVDHGLESAEDRIKAGKNPQGRVLLRAIHQGDHIRIEVQDDGRGLDAQKLIAKAREKGIIKPNQTLTDDQAHQLIFASGFSTKEQVTDVSGRGVGMDVVRSNVMALQGDIQIDTELGKGTCIRIILPLTLSIIDGMVVKCGEERYVVPITHVYESVQPTKADVVFATGLGEVLNLRGENVPLHRLGALLNRKIANGREYWDSIAIVVRTGKFPFAVLVDDIIGQQQVVIKRLGSEVRNIKGVSGGAILGDGRAALILDFPELSAKAVPKATSGAPSTITPKTSPQKPQNTLLKEVA